MTDGTKGFVLVALLVVMGPLLLVAMFSLARRHPDGVPPRWRWLLPGAAVLLYAGLCIDAAFRGDWLRAGVFILAAATFTVLALHQKRESRVIRDDRQG
jgi:hypothetical protein